MLAEGLLFQIQELRVTSQKEIIWMAWITGYSYDFWCFLVGTVVPTVSRFCCLKTRQGDGSAQGSRLGSGSLCSLGVPGFDTWPCSRSQLPPLVLCRGGSDDLEVGSLSPTRETYTEALASGVSSPACCRCSRNEAVNGGLYFCLFGKRNVEARWLFWILTGESGCLYFFS